MKRAHLLSQTALAATLLASAFGATPALATSIRTAVSIFGTDTGTCPPATPCRTFNYALSQTTAGGAVFVMNSGGYGPFTIDKAVTIEAPTGTVAAINAASGVGVTVNAGVNDIVILNGLMIDGLGTGTDGIVVNSALTVRVSGSSISNFAGNGINFIPNVGAGLSHLTVAGSILFSNAANAIKVQPTGGTAGSSAGQVSISDSSIASSAITFDTTNSLGRISGQISNSTLRYNPGSGLVANAVAGVPVYVQVSNSTFNNLTSALVANGANAIITVNLSSLSSISTIATASNSGAVYSFGNNGIYFYTTLGPLGTLPQK